MVWDEEQVRASNLDSSLVEGQATFYCSRTAGVRLPEVTDEGKRIYRAGGTYAIWTDQPRA